MSDYDRDMEDLDDSGRGRGRGGGRFGPRRNKFCNFCLDKVKEVPYKDGDLLRRYLTDRGKIRPRLYRPRGERNAAYNRLTLTTAGSISSITPCIPAGAVMLELVITPNQPVAVVGGHSISTHDFQRRVVFERWRQGSFLANMVNQFGQYGQQMLTGQGSPYAQLYQQLSQPALMGQQVLDQMTNDLLIKQYADANNIKADDADIQKRVEEFFGYQSVPTTPTATITPSITPTLLVSPTPT